MKLNIIPLFLFLSPLTALPTAEEPTPGENEIFITPGPGLPSLESLGITPAQLYNMSVDFVASQALEAESSKRSLAKRAPECQTFDRVAVDTNLAACILYLAQNGGQLCFTPSSGRSVFCTSSGAGGGAQINGATFGGVSLSTFCSVVSNAAIDLRNTCYRCHGGFCGATGNNFLTTAGINWRVRVEPNF
jgi:hypothetical protein